MRDTEMFSIIDKEAKRQKQNVELIASENFAAMSVIKSIGRRIKRTKKNLIDYIKRKPSMD